MSDPFYIRIIAVEVGLPDHYVCRLPVLSWDAVPDQYPVIPGIGNNESFTVRPQSGRVEEGSGIDLAPGITSGIGLCTLAQHHIRCLKLRIGQSVPNENPVLRRICYKKATVNQEDAPRRQQRTIGCALKNAGTADQRR